VNPVLINPSGVVIAGHGRLRAARSLGVTSVPTITISGLSEAEERRLRIADNKIALNAGWDSDLLKVELSEIELSGLDLSVTGFSIGEIDVLREMKIEGLVPYECEPTSAVDLRTV
jgi:ParB-like chromosome segregation protein Spo0J